MGVHEVDVASGGKDAGDDDELEKLIRTAWPGGLTAVDAAAKEALDSDGRQKLRLRLAALLRWREPGSDASAAMDAAEAARLAGLGQSHFYKIARDWSLDRSVASLGLHAAGPLRRTSGLSAARREEMVEAIIRLMAAQPPVRFGDVFRHVVGRFGDAPSKTTVLRLIDEARRRMPAGPFGATIVFDSPGLDLVDPEGRRLRLYMAIDAGTGVVLGSVPATDRFGAASYALAAEAAAEAMIDMELPAAAFAGGPPGLDFRIAPADGPGRELLEGLGGSSVALTSERRLGSFAVRVLGDRLGRVWLGTGERPEGVGFRTGRRRHLPVATPPIVDSIDDAVIEHNRARIGFAGAGPVDGATSETREAMRGRLGQVAALTASLKADSG